MTTELQRSRHAAHNFDHEVSESLARTRKDASPSRSNQCSPRLSLSLSASSSSITQPPEVLTFRSLLSAPGWLSPRNRSASPRPDTGSPRQGPPRGPNFTDLPVDVIKLIVHLVTRNSVQPLASLRQSCRLLRNLCRDDATLNHRLVVGSLRRLDAACGGPRAKSLQVFLDGIARHVAVLCIAPHIHAEVALFLTALPGLRHLKMNCTYLPPGRLLISHPTLSKLTIRGCPPYIPENLDSAGYRQLPSFASPDHMLHFSLRLPALLSLRSVLFDYVAGEDMLTVDLSSLEQAHFDSFYYISPREYRAVMGLVSRMPALRQLTYTNADPGTFLEVFLVQNAEYDTLSLITSISLREAATCVKSWPEDRPVRKLLLPIRSTYGWPTPELVSALLARCSDLSELDIHVDEHARELDDSSDAIRSMLPHMTQLTSLSYHYGYMPSADSLEACSAITRLSLINIKRFEPAGIEISTAILSHIRRLNLTGSLISDTDFAAMCAAMFVLERLNVCGCRMLSRAAMFTVARTVGATLRKLVFDSGLAQTVFFDAAYWLPACRIDVNDHYIDVE